MTIARFGAMFGKIDQIGHVVTELDASVRRWTELMGVGPWLIFRNVRLPGRVRGKDTLVEMDVALGYQGDIQIELIHQTNDAPSPYRDAAGTPLVGMHHIAWVVDDRAAAIAAAEARGLRIAFEAENPAAKVAYFEHPDEPGLLFEVIEGAANRTMIADGIAASRAWDGSDPVTEIDLSA